MEVLEDVAEPVHAEALARRVHRALDLVPGSRSMIHEMRRMANQFRGMDAAPGRYADAVANASDLHPEARYEVARPSPTSCAASSASSSSSSNAPTRARRSSPGTRPHLN